MATTHKWPWFLVFLYIGAVLSAYVIFDDHKISEASSSWGTLGDYFGGMINPLISMVALYFLMKTYQAQKDELSETKKALQESADHQKATATAQAEQVEIEIRRLASSEKQIIVQALAAEISSKFEEIKFYMSEVNRMTEALNKNWHTTSIDGRSLNDNEVRTYRTQNTEKANILLQETKKLQKRLNTLHSSEEAV